MGEKIKKYYDYIAAGLLTLITFFGLAFPLIKLGVGGPGTGDNGFQFISFTGGVVPLDENWLSIIAGVFCLLQLAVCVFMVIYFIKIFCKGGSEADKKIFFIFNIIMLCFLFVYTLIGFLFVGLNDIGGGIIGQRGYTLAYLPLILGVFVFIFYCFQKLSNGDAPVEKAPKAKKSAKKAVEAPAEETE